MYIVILYIYIYISRQFITNVLQLTDDFSEALVSANAVMHITALYLVMHITALYLVMHIIALYQVHIITYITHITYKIEIRRMTYISRYILFKI